MSDDAKLRELRAKIDALDEQLQGLIARRARLALDVARVKHGSGENNFYRPEREAEVLSKVLARNKGPLDDETVARLFREIMSACLALESPLKIAFLGPAGTFTQEAALKHFGHAVGTVPLGAIDEVFREVESGNARFGVVPVENSTEGVINHTLDMFHGTPLKICGEVELRIHHHLLGSAAVPDAALPPPSPESKGAAIKNARRVLSHPQSLAQCREWLDARLPGVERVAVSSNAEAARLAARLYGLNVLVANIEDRPDNTTRFLVIGDIETKPSGNDKTSLLVSGKNVPGALSRLLAPLARNKINMTRIESRPSRRTVWEYVFFVDIDGHAKDKKLRQALAELEREAALLKWLGSYPKAVL